MLTDSLQRRLRRVPLMDEVPGTRVQHARDAVMRLIPHRDPLLFVDGIDAVDLDARAVRGRVTLDPSWPMFAGHFPGEPVFPGALAVEAMGQLALTLIHFCGRNTSEVPASLPPLRVRAIRIHDAKFISPLLPGQAVTMMAQIVEWNYTLIVATQAWTDDALACHAVSEVLADE